MTEQLLITPPVCAHTISTSNSRTSLFTMMSSDEFQAKQRTPPRRLLGLVCRLPAGLVSPNSGNSSTEAQKKKTTKKQTKTKNWEPV